MKDKKKDPWFAEKYDPEVLDLLTLKRSQRKLPQKSS